MPIKNPSNVGCASAVYFNLSSDPLQSRVVAVQSIERRQRVQREIQECGISRQDAYQKLRAEKRLGPPDNWKLPGGEIEFWTAHILQQEYESLGTPGEKELTEEQKQSLETVGERLLLDDTLLQDAAHTTALLEFLEETGLHVKQEQIEFLMRRNDRDKDGLWPFYPRFWYLVRKASGELSTTPGDDDISPPEWIPLMRLFPKRQDSYYPFHAGHVPAIKMALGRFVEEGRQDLIPIIQYLEQAFPFTPVAPRPSEVRPPKGPMSDEEAFEAAMMGVKPL